MNQTFTRISQLSGQQPSECKCEECVNQCKRAPCLGTPQDIERLIDAGYGSGIQFTAWAAGITMGVFPGIIWMFQPEHKETGCAFLKNGLCELHDKNLKPTEGILTHHSCAAVLASKSPTWLVAREWLNIENAETIFWISEKLKLQSINQTTITQ